MRRSKYRAWHKKQKRMLKVDSICFSLNRVICKYPEYDTPTWESLDNFILMEYTGQQNCYEGDLIPYHFNEDVKGVVKFGEYKNPTDDVFTSHIGFYVEFSDEKYRNLRRKDLGYWLSVSHVDGNVCEGKLC